MELLSKACTKSSRNRNEATTTAERKLHRYEVRLPDERVKLVTLDSMASGYDCLRMVCHSVGIFDEADYFGLTYPGSCGEELWVNSRNRLDKQVPTAARCLLRLAVRFFVQPHMLVLAETRHLFFLETKRRFQERHPSREQPASLEVAARLPEYGCCFYPALDCFCASRCIRVDPQAVCICGEDGIVLERFAFPRVQKVTKSGHLVYLLLSNQDGDTKEIGFRLASKKAATGLYRCVTETHSFFRCDTVRSGVSEQKCRDLKTTLASLIFLEASNLNAPKFAFDVRKTAKEVHDSARRRQFRHCMAAAASPEQESDSKPATGSDKSVAASSLSQKLQSMRQERICRLCADQTISVVFLPCGHMIACPDCADKLQECPLCRQTVTMRQVCHLP